MNKAQLEKALAEAQAQLEAVQTAPLSTSEVKADSVNESALFRLANKVVADCKGRDHVKWMESPANGRTQTNTKSRGLGLALKKDATDEVKHRQKAVAGLELFLDSIQELIKSDELDDTLVHLRKLVKTLDGKQLECRIKLDVEAATVAAMK